MTKLKLVPTPTPNSGPQASPPSERFLTGIVEPGSPYLVPLPGGASRKAPEQALAVKSIKDYPLAVRKRAREIVKERWDRQSQQPPEQAPGLYLQKPLAVRKKARELARAKLDRKYPPRKS